MKAERLASGQYRVRVQVGGRRYSFTARTAEAAIRKAELKKAAYLLSGPAAGENEIVSDILDRYINDRRGVLSPSTLRGYIGIRHTRFQDVMSQPYSRVNWQRAVSDEAETCSPKTLRNSWMLLCSAFNAAGLQKPRVTLPMVPKAERPYLDPQQINVFLGAIRGTDIELAALLGLHSLRRSEILAVEKQDVDLTAGIIHVHGAIVAAPDGGYVKKKANKTDKSDRRVPILFPRLSELVEAAPAGRLVQVHPNAIYSAVNTICRNAGLPEIGAHGLRHSMASACYAAKIPERVAMRWGGWSDIQTMHRIYTHISEHEVDKYAEQLRDFLK